MSFRVSRRGLTRTELLVVGAILVTAIGVLVPMMPGMLIRARTAEQAANTVRLFQAWQIFRMRHPQRLYPDGLDSLVDREGAIYARLPGRKVADLFAVQTPAELAAEMDAAARKATALVDRMRAVGIRHVYAMDSTTANATLEPYGPGVAHPTAIPVGVGTPLVRVSSAVVAGKFNAPADGIYVVLGIGARCTISDYGGIEGAPFHVADVPEANPAACYARYGVIFNLRPAQPELVGVVAFHADGIATTRDAMQDYDRSPQQQ